MDPRPHVLIMENIHSGFLQLIMPCFQMLFACTEDALGVLFQTGKLLNISANTLNGNVIKRPTIRRGYMYSLGPKHCLYSFLLALVRISTFTVSLY